MVSDCHRATRNDEALAVSEVKVLPVNPRRPSAEGRGSLSPALSEEDERWGSSSTRSSLRTRTGRRAANSTAATGYT